MAKRLLALGHFRLVRVTVVLRMASSRKPKRACRFRLEELTKANGISHSNAHDALADVHAAHGAVDCTNKIVCYYFALRNKRGKVLEPWRGYSMSA